MWGGEGVYDVLTFQKSRGGKSSPGGAKAPSVLNEALVMHSIIMHCPVV